MSSFLKIIYDLRWNLYISETLRIARGSLSSFTIEQANPKKKTLSESTSVSVKNSSFARVHRFTRCHHNPQDWKIEINFSEWKFHFPLETMCEGDVRQKVKMFFHVSWLFCLSTFDFDSLHGILIFFSNISRFSIEHNSSSWMLIAELGMKKYLNGTWNVDDWRKKKCFTEMRKILSTHLESFQWNFRSNISSRMKPKPNKVVKNILCVAL